MKCGGLARSSSRDQRQIATGRIVIHRPTGGEALINVVEVPDSSLITPADNVLWNVVASSAHALLYPLDSQFCAIQPHKRQVETVPLLA